MKTATLLISFLLIQSGSSTFTEGIDRVMTNMETSFSRLLNDVITDMKDVIDCTILAVEQALSFGFSYSASEYQRRCGDGIPDYESEAKETEIQSGENFSNEVEQVEDQLSSAITDMNNTFHNAIDSNELHAKLDNIRLVLRNETDHLASVNTLFKDRLDKISDKIRRHPDQNDDFFRDIFTRLEMLHEAENSEYNADEIHKIHDVINEIVKILQLDESKLNAADDGDKIQVIIDKLSQHVKVNETMHQPDDGRDNSTEVPSNKEIHTSTKETKTITTEITNTMTSNEVTQTTPSAKKESTKKKSNYDDPFDLSSLLELDEIKTSDKFSDDVANIIRNQKESELIINKYFNNPNYIVGDAFSESDREMSEEELRNFDLDSLFDDFQSH